MRVSSFLRGGVAAVAAAAAVSAMAAEYPIGKQQIQGGMEIGAVYLQPITMEPEGMMRKASDSDVHLEADIHAVKNNPTGFAEGDWMPYLQVGYELTKAGSTQTQKGDMMAMVAERRPALRRQRQAARPGQISPEALHCTADANRPHGVRPSRRQGNGRRPVVQAVHARVRLHVRRHRQEGRVLIAAVNDGVPRDSRLAFGRGTRANAARLPQADDARRRNNTRRVFWSAQ